MINWLWTDILYEIGLGNITHANEHIKLRLDRQCLFGVFVCVCYLYAQLTYKYILELKCFLMNNHDEVWCHRSSMWIMYEFVSWSFTLQMIQICSWWFYRIKRPENWSHYRIWIWKGRLCLSVCVWACHYSIIAPHWRQSFGCTIVHYVCMYVIWMSHRAHNTYTGWFCGLRNVRVQPETQSSIWPGKQAWSVKNGKLN